MTRSSLFLSFSLSSIMFSAVPFCLYFIFQVHPDKNKHPRAGEAFKVLRAAWDIVSNPETRREYELWVEDAQATGPVLIWNARNYDHMTSPLTKTSEVRTQASHNRITDGEAFLNCGP